MKPVKLIISSLCKDEKKIYAIANKLVLTLNGILTVFIIIGSLPKYQFGLLALFNTFDFFVFAVCGGLVLQGLQKYAAECQGNELNILVSNGIILYLVFSLGSSLIIVLCAPFITELLNASGLDLLLKWFPLFVISFWGRKLAYYLLLAKEKVKLVFWVDAIPFLIKAILIVTIWIKGDLTSAFPVIISIIIANIVGTVFCVYFMGRLYKFQFQYSQSWIKKILNFGKYSLGSTIGHIIHTRTDTIMIPFFFEPVALAGYSAARGIADFFRHFVQAVNMIILPRASLLAAQGDNDGIRSLFYKGLIFSFFLVIPIVAVLCLLPTAILDFAYHGRYNDSAAILRIFALCTLISPFGTIASSIAGGIGKPRYTFIAIWVSVVINMTLNLLLIPRFGGIGAVYATFIAMLIGGGTIVFLINRSLDLIVSPFKIIKNL